ncbi:MAG: efflux RND transporter periplasmic adaptor subunit [Planctomycetota bacterium]
MNRRSMLYALRRWGVAVAVLAAMTLLVMWLSGVFGQKTPPTQTPNEVGRKLPAGTVTLTVDEVAVPVVEEAVGSIRAIQRVQVASRLLARVVAMHVASAGQAVTQNQVLVELEDQDLRARLSEAQAANRAAVETAQQAERDLARTRELHAQKIASDLDLERDSTRVESTKAEVDRTQQAAVAAETLLGYAVIRSPIDGVVVDKLVEKGDTVAPGQVLMNLYDPTRMQLVASVREQLATRLKVGGEVEVAIDALGMRCHGTVAEIVPQSEAGSRAFDVKVTGPCPDGVFSGMFGRLFVDLGQRNEIRIPRSAVRSIGQVDLVMTVREDGTLQRRFVVLGETAGDEVAVLSGLQKGEKLVRDVQQLRESSPR